MLGSLIVMASIFYGAAKYYSPSLILYVVEQSLLQKSPSGTDSNSLRERLRAHISAAPDKKSQIERLLRISEYLEKVQSIDSKQLNQILPVGTFEKPGVSRISRGFLKNTGKMAGEHPAL